MVETIGDRLRTLRTKHGFSQATLAEACGVSSGAIKSIEQGRRPDPSFSTVLRLVKALGGSLVVFDGVAIFEGTEPAEPPSPPAAPAKGSSKPATGRTSEGEGDKPAEKPKRGRGKK